MTELEPLTFPLALRFTFVVFSAMIIKGCAILLSKYIITDVFISTTQGGQSSISANIKQYIVQSLSQITRCCLSFSPSDGNESLMFYESLLLMQQSHRQAKVADALTTSRTRW